MVDSVSDPVCVLWRVGRTVGRTVYAQSGDIPGDDDALIGVMDTRALAAATVEAHNILLAGTLVRMELSGPGRFSNVDPVTYTPNGPAPVLRPGDSIPPGSDCECGRFQDEPHKPNCKAKVQAEREARAETEAGERAKAPYP